MKLSFSPITAVSAFSLRRAAFIRIVQICLLLWLVCPRAAHSYIIINAPMTDTNSSGWVLGGNPASAYLTGTGGAAPNYDPVGSGWLRITNNSGNQTGFAYNTTSFDLSSGALIQFDYASWGGNGADGISVFLFDAGVSPFNIGAFGGSLGYAQKLPPTVNPAVPGVSGGYVGIGIDEFGNFSNPTEGRYLGPGAAPNTVTLRGPVNGFGGGAVGNTAATNSYPWIATSASGGSLWTGTRPDQFSTNYRKVIIQISPAPNPTVDVWIQFGYNTAPVHMVSGQSLPAISASQQLMVGFGGSTGGNNNYHDLRNLLITNLNESTAIDLGITKTAVTTGTTTAITSANVGASFDYLITARNYGPNNITATGVGITDTLPMTITPGTWNCTASGGATCGAAPGSGNLNTTANLPRSGVVTYRVPVTLNSMPAGNLLSNTASLAIPGAVIDYNSGNNSVTSTINAYGPTTVTKTFAPASVPLSTSSALTVTLTNPNNVAATGVGFTDTYPTNLLNAATAVTPQCGGTITAANNGKSLVLANGTIPANGSCTITVNVDSATAATYTNTIAKGAVTTTNIGSNAAAATGTLVVTSAPTVAKSFAAVSMASGDNTNQTVTINNPNASAITLTSALTDTFPAGMTINTAGNTGTCTGVTATAGDNKFTMANGTSIPAVGCTVIVNVTSTATGINTIAAGALQTSAGNNAAAASATLTVYNHANLTKTYSAASIGVGVTSTLTFSIANGATNPAQSSLAFTDTLPAGLTVTAVGAVTGTGCSGTTAFTPSTVSLTGGAITAGRGPCTFTTTVQGNTAGTYVNNSAQFSGQDGGLDTSGTTATLNVYTSPTVSKSFSPTSITVGGTTVLTLTLANPAANPGAVTTNKVSDTFPAGLTLQNATFTFTPSACGTVTKISGTGSAAGDNNVLFSAASLASGVSCQVQMNITSSLANNFTNTTGAPTATGPIALTGTTATATLNGTQAPSVSKAFAAGNIANGGNTNLTVTISNTNASTITLTSDFTDAFPTGLTIRTAGSTGTCGGVTATAGAGSFTVANGTSLPTGGCTVIVNVTSSTAGAAANTIPIGAVQTTTGSNTLAASATLNVYAPPTVTKSFTPTGVSYGGSTTLTLTLGNPAANVAAITTVGVDDIFPAGLTLQNTTFTFTPAACGSITKTTGTASAAGDNNIRFTAATIASGTTCQVAVNVTSSASGINTTNAPTATGPVALTGTAAGPITLTVTAVAPTVTKAFTVDNLASGGNTSMTVTIGNGNAGAITLTSAFTDTFPAGMTIGTAGNSGTCSGVTATAGDNKFTMANGTSIPAGGCTVIINVKSSTPGTATNTITTGALQTVAGSNTLAASDTLTVYAPPTLIKTFGASSISAGGGTTMTLTLGNPSANVAAITTVSVDDIFPPGLSLQNTTFTFNPSSPSPCGTVTNTTGAASAVGDSNIRFTAATIAPGTTCQVTVNVTSSTAGSITNTTNAPTAAGPIALTGAAASANLGITLLPSPGVTKSFFPSQIETTGASTLTITLTNPNAIDITGVNFTDNFPTSPGQMILSGVVTNNCGGSAGVLNSNKGISLSSGTIPANKSCTIFVSVSAPTLGSYTNVTSTVGSTNAQATLAGATDYLTVASVSAPKVTKSFTQSQVGLNVDSLLTITIQNVNNSVGLTNVNFTDTYPSPLITTSTPNATNCGGSVTAVSGSLSLTGGTIAANTTCTITVKVASAMAGNYINNLTVTTGNAGNATASATLNVLQPLTVTKAFSAPTILPGGTSTMTITLANPNNIAVTTNTAFTDSYPSGLTNSGSVNTPSCGSASNTTNSVTLASGATISGGGSCSIIVNVTASSVGTYTNTVAAGSIGTTNAGSEPAAAVTAALTVAQPTVQIAKTSNNGTGTFGFAGTNGVAANFNIITATAGTPVSGSVYTVTSTASNVTVIETPPAGWPANPVSASCTDSNGTVSGNGASAFGTLSGNVLTILPANLRAGAQILCAYVNTKPTVQVQKTSTNGIGTFSYAMANLATTSDSITTTVANTPVNGVANNIVTSAGSAVTITETAPAGWPANPASASCTDTNGAISGNGADTFGTLAGNVLTIPTTNLKPAAQIVCSFTNTLATPTVQVRKTSNNGTSTFAFAGTNGVAANFNIATATAGTPVAGSVYSVTSTAANVTVAETPPAGWPVNPVSASCIDSNSAITGNLGSFGTLAGNVMTILPANLKPGAQILCSFVNTKPTVQVQKTSTNGTGTFTYAMTNLATASDSIITTVAGTPVNGVANNIITSAGSAVTITETAPAGWPANPVSASCTDANGAVSGNGAGTFGTLAGNILTIPAVNLRPAAQILCSFTNTLSTPTVQLRKTSNNGTGTFAFAGTNGVAANFNIITATAGTPVSGSVYTVTSTTSSVTVTETPPAGWPVNPVSAACTDSNGAVSGNGAGAFGTLAANVLTILPANLKPGAQIVCSFVNTSIATITVTQVLLPSSDSGKFNLVVGATTVATNVGDTGTGNTSVAANTAVTVSETAGTATSLANYTTTYSCTGGSVGNGTSVNITPTPGQAITCTYTNTRKTATVTLQKTWANALVGDAVNVTATGLTTLNSVANSANKTDAGSAQSIFVGSVLTLGESFTTGSAANYTSVLSCTGTSGLAGNTLTVSSGDTAIVCTQTNTRKTANLILQKTWANALVGDTVNVTATGLTTLNSVANTASETDAGGVQTMHAGDAITMAEAFTVGTAANYTQVLSCSGNATALVGNVLTVNSADTAIVCTYTNTRKTANLTLQKTWVNAIVNDAVNVTATGLTSLSSVAITANKTDVGGVQTVRAGDVVTIGEAFTAGSAVNYTSVLACNGTSGLSGTVLTVGAADTNIVCTMTNTGNGVAVSGTVYNDGNHNGVMDGGESGTAQSLYVKLLPRSGGSCFTPARAAVMADPAMGAYTIPSATAGDYCLILATNGDLNDPTPAWPGGWIAMETPTGIRSITVATTPLTAQNFGMYHGSKLSGKVFSDTGLGGGIPNDGVQNGGEPGLAGVTVRVTDSSGGTVYDSATTNGSGDYTFWIPAAAGSTSLKVVETNPNGYISTGGNQGTTGGSYDRASDTVTFTNILGSIYTGVTFADVPANTFVANNSRSVVAGGVVFYPHTFTAGTGGIVTFSTSAVASPAISGWSEVLYLDSNCNGSIDPGEPQITAPITTTAGQQLCILVKEFAPTGAPLNATNTATISANFNYSNSILPTAALTMNDLTTVSPSGLTLIKYVDKSAALPGDTLTYIINYANTGAIQLTNIVIADSVPAFTSLIPPTSTTVCCVNPSTACLGTPPTPYPASITACTTATTATSVTWTLLGTLSPGASGQVKFSVMIQK